jgi:UDP-N-acetylmuramyl-tripeptide synthetase
MNLRKILKRCKSNIIIYNFSDFRIDGISTNSNEIKNNFIFAAIRGSSENGEKFITNLLGFERIVIIISKNSDIKIDFDIYKKIILLKVNDVRKLVSEIASLLYPNSIGKKLAITGTNGKTSVVSYTHQLWQMANINSASVGTLGLKYNNRYLNKAGLTTPESVRNQKNLMKLEKLGCKKVIFEASSIGLDQKRLYPIKFDVVGFTNLSIDHLDYHKSIKNYRNSKALLFSEHTKKSSIAVINSDSKFSKFFFKICENFNLKIMDYGKKARFLKIKSIKKIDGYFKLKIEFGKRIIEKNIDCCSEFEIYNRLCALLLAFNKNINHNHFDLICKLKNPSGRLEKVYDKKKIKVYIDYAHTPDALSNVLSSLKEITVGRLILVFGCGGNRDNTKRSLMTKEALKYSDLIIITDDNPRFENPEKIRNDMIRGIAKDQKIKIKDIGNRSQAIKFAIKNLKSNDLLLIAGKGHENYQIIRSKKIFFSDKETAKRFLKKK